MTMSEKIADMAKELGMSTDEERMLYMFRLKKGDISFFELEPGEYWCAHKPDAKHTDIYHFVYGFVVGKLNGRWILHSTLNFNTLIPMTSVPTPFIDEFFNDIRPLMRRYLVVRNLEAYDPNQVYEKLSLSAIKERIEDYKRGIMPGSDRSGASKYFDAAKYAEAMADLHADVGESTDEEELGEMSTKDTKATDEEHVNHPSHYQSASGIEAIDAMAAATEKLSGMEALCTANAIKYLWRWKEKNGKEDLRKAIWYINKLLEE